MRTWKIFVVGALLRVAFIIAVAVAASNGFGFGTTVADHGKGSPQQQISIVNLVGPAAKTDMGETPNTEPWGPFRTTDW